MSGVLPERVILGAIRTGIEAILTDLSTSAPGSTVLDDILSDLDATEQAKARAIYAKTPPSLQQGYARKDASFPLFALTLASDTLDHDYIGVGELDTLGLGDEPTGAEFHRFVSGAFAILVYAEHPDICAWYYRVLKRILNAATPFLISNGLDDPKMQGADLAPDPRYTPDNLFIRRLTLTVYYDEEWSNTDALWRALNGEPEPFITEPEQIEVRRDDTFTPDQGGIGTFELTIDV